MNSYNGPPPGPYGSQGAPPGQGYGTPAQGWGAPGAGPNPYAPPTYPAQQPVASVGLFGAIPCPQCGLPTTAESGTGGQAARYAGGLVGILLYRAFAAKHYCPQHGLIPSSAFPPQHRSAILLRKVALIGGALLLLVVCLALLFVLQQI